MASSRVLASKRAWESRKRMRAARAARAAPSDPPKADAPEADATQTERVNEAERPTDPHHGGKIY